MHQIKKFFRVEPNEHGGCMGENEDATNAVYRNLSLYSDDELAALAMDAQRFIDAITNTLEERNQ